MHWILAVAELKKFELWFVTVTVSSVIKKTLHFESDKDLTSCLLAQQWTG